MEQKNVKETKHHHYETAPEDKLAIKEKGTYGFGILSDHIGVNTLNQLANPIFNITLGVNPLLIGTALGIMRIWDGLTDPLFGWLSDNTRTRWGRRRPFMLVGSILCGLMFPLVWFASPGWNENTLFIYFTVFSILYFTAQTIYTVPYTALGYELTPDYHERTRLMVWRAYFGKAASLFAPWAFAVTQLPLWGGDTMMGARAMGISYGLIIMGMALIPVFTLSERFFKKAKNQEKIGFIQALKFTFTNKPFLLMVCITLFTVLGTQLVNHLGFYIGLYYLWDGDTQKQGILTGVAGNVQLVLGLASVYVLNLVSRRVGKRRALELSLWLLVLSGPAEWLLYTPKYPYLSIGALFFTVPAFAGFWLLISSIKADVCDWDELQSGLRREGSIAALSAWISKMGYSLTAILSGGIIVLTGYDADLGNEQSERTIDAMRYLFYIVPSASAIVALFLVRRFPITEESAHQTRLELEARRGKM